MITNFDLRQRMRRVIKPNMQVLLVIALIAALPSLIASVVNVMTYSNLINYLYDNGVDTAATIAQLMEALEAFFFERGWIIPAVGLVQVLVAPVLTLGLIYATLTLLRGGTATVSTVFSRIGVWFRSILLFLLVMLKVFLWMLPGVALITVTMLLGNDTLFTITSAVAPLLMAVPALMAAYRYAMAEFFLADEPETGVIACVRQSKAVMQGRKLQLLSLELPYLAGSYLASSLISILLSGAIGGMLSMMVQLIFTVYLYGARCAFFEAYSRPGGGMAHAFQSDPYHDDPYRGEMKE